MPIIVTQEGEFIMTSLKLPTMSIFDKDNREMRKFSKLFPAETRAVLDNTLANGKPMEFVVMFCEELARAASSR
jgi:hypothetical protein